MKRFSQKALGLCAEDLTTAQAKQMVEALRPMLKTLVGTVQCDRFIAQLALELGLRE